MAGKPRRQTNPARLGRKSPERHLLPDLQGRQLQDVQGDGGLRQKQTEIQNRQNADLRGRAAVMAVRKGMV